MTAPNMAAITALERSLQNFSINQSGEGHGGGVGGPGAVDRPEENQIDADVTLELNSHDPLPYQWQQCLDIKTGEVYYINWSDGTKTTEDPRKAASFGEDFNFEEDSFYDSEGSDSSQSPSEDYRHKGDHVLVVAGCKRCLMYFMLPKQVEVCPKCRGRLLHFDRSEDGCP